MTPILGSKMREAPAEADPGGQQGGKRRVALGPFQREMYRKHFKPNGFEPVRKTGKGHVVFQGAGVLIFCPGTPQNESMSRILLGKEIKKAIELRGGIVGRRTNTDKRDREQADWLVDWLEKFGPATSAKIENHYKQRFGDQASGAGMLRVRKVAGVVSFKDGAWFTCLPHQVPVDRSAIPADRSPKKTPPVNTLMVETDATIDESAGADPAHPLNPLMDEFGYLKDEKQATEQRIADAAALAARDEERAAREAKRARVVASAEEIGKRVVQAAGLTVQTDATAARGIKLLALVSEFVGGEAEARLGILREAVTEFSVTMRGALNELDEAIRMTNSEGSDSVNF